MGKPLLGQMMDMPLLVSSLIAHAARHAGDVEIVSRRVEGDIHRYTYRDCEARSKRLAQALTRLGVGVGDRIGTLAWNGYRHVEAYYGISGMGAVCHTINPRLFPEQIAYIVNHAEDRYVLFDLTFAPLVDQLAPQCPNVKGWIAMTDDAHLPRGATPYLCYETLVGAQDGDYAWPLLDERQASSLCYTRAALREAARAHDVIVTCGGVSVGDEDHVKPAVEAEGRLALWQIAMKPGKPLAFGAIRRGGAAGGTAGGEASADDAAGASDASAAPGGEAYFIGLPGNPVSSFVTFLLFVRPFLLRVAGATQVAPRAVSLRADFTQSKADRRNEFLRARVNAAGGLDLFPNQSSAVLTSTVWSDGLIDNPPNHAISAGETVRFIPFSELLG